MGGWSPGRRCRCLARKHAQRGTSAARAHSTSGRVDGGTDELIRITITGPAATCYNEAVSERPKVLIEERRARILASLTHKYHFWHCHDRRSGLITTEVVDLGA